MRAHVQEDRQTMRIAEETARIKQPGVQSGGLSDFPAHLHLPILPPDQQLVVDPRAKSKSKFGIVSLLIDSPASSAKVVHQVFSPVALRLFIPLIKSPQFCPYHYLLAAYQSDWDMVETLLPASSVETAPHFYNLACMYEQRLEEAQATSSEAWEWELRPIRRAMTEIIRNVGDFGLNVFTLRSSGYRIERVIRELHVRKGGPKRERVLQYG